MTNEKLEKEKKCLLKNISREMSVINKIVSAEAMFNKERVNKLKEKYRNLYFNTNHIISRLIGEGITSDIMFPNKLKCTKEEIIAESLMSTHQTFYRCSKKNADFYYDSIYEQQKYILHKLQIDLLKRVNDPHSILKNAAIVTAVSSQSIRADLAGSKDFVNYIINPENTDIDINSKEVREAINDSLEGIKRENLDVTKFLLKAIPSFDTTLESRNKLFSQKLKLAAFTILERKYSDIYMSKPINININDRRLDNYLMDGILVADDYVKRKELVKNNNN